VNKASSSGGDDHPASGQICARTFIRKGNAYICTLTEHPDTPYGHYSTAENPRHTSVDAVNHPPHYTSHPSGVECITVTEHMNFCIGNAVKYLWRADLKNGLEDLEKAEWYVRREIERRKRASC
jgi:hypothetical protein